MNTTPYSEGNPDAHICILGEAPARSEMRLGRPFVGPAGKLLDYCMHAGGMARKECYLTNVWEFPVTKRAEKIYSPDGELLWTKKGLTEIGTKLAEPCYERLTRSGANVVVALGGTALSYLYNDSRIMKWRGSILRSNVKMKKLIPTIHPAASLRGQYLYRYIIASDLKRAKEESKSPQLDLPHRNLLVSPTLVEALGFLSDATAKKAIAIDIEVLNHQVSCFSIATSPSEVMSIPLIDGQGQHRWSEQEEADVWLHFAAIMSHPDILKIGHNIIFDINFLLGQNNIFTRGPLGDTMIAHHIMYPDFLKGLDFVNSLYTREPYYKDDGKIWQKPWADPILFWEYNCKDSAVAYEIWEALSLELDEKGYRKTYDFTMALFPSLQYMMLRGIKVNREKLERTKKDVERRITEKEEALDDAAEHKFNPGSPKQCIEYFYGTKAIKPYISRKTGNPTTDDKAMARIFRRYRLPEAKLVQEIRSLRKLHSSYLSVGIDRDDRIRCSYNPRGTTTGRLSSSATIFGTGLNLQNLHPEFKGFLVADN